MLETLEVAEKNQAKNSAPSAGLSDNEIHEEKADAELLKLERAEKDWLDYLVAFFAFIASLGAIAAALVASYQGWVARDTEKRQLRAYVFLESVQTANTDDRAGNNQYPDLSATIVFKNFGQTPAYNVRHSSSLRFADYPPPATVFVYDRETHPIIVDTLGPQGGARNVIRSSEADSMSAIERKQLMKAQTKAIYVFGKIDYEDAFGVGRCTSYRFMVGGNSGVLGGDMLRMDSGNEADRNCEKSD
jgi:type II secretory pathway pseudopilin PulG